MVNINRFNGSSNILDDLSDKTCVPNKTNDINLSVFNMITRLNESKTLTKNIRHGNIKVNLMEENVIQIKSGITINVDPCGEI